MKMHNVNTHKVNTDGANVALSVCIILRHPHNNPQTTQALQSQY